MTEVVVTTGAITRAKPNEITSNKPTSNFLQAGCPSRCPTITQKWLQVNCPEFIIKDKWPPNSLVQWTIMSQVPKPKSITELKEALQLIWHSLPQEPINKAYKLHITTEEMHKSWWWTIQAHKVTINIKKCSLCCFSDALLLCGFSPNKFARWTGHTKVSIFSSYLKTVKYSLAVKCSLSHIKV